MVAWQSEFQLIDPVSGRVPGIKQWVQPGPASLGRWGLAYPVSIFLPQIQRILLAGIRTLAIEILFGILHVIFPRGLLV